MTRVILVRLISVVPLLFLVTLGTFGLGLMIPGDPAYTIAGENISEELIDQIRTDLRLDLSPPVRYIHWLGDVVQGDLGRSVTSRRSVTEELLRRWPVTVSLSLCAILIALAVGMPIGIVQGVRPGTALDKGLLAIVSLGLATPGFWIATVLLFVFAVRLRWLPAIGYVPFAESPVEWARHIAMPVVTLGIVAAAEFARQLRSGLIDVTGLDYVRAARARGLPSRTVLVKHALRNAAMPALTIIGIRVGHLLGGSIVIEQIFQLPGLGTYVLTAVGQRDYIVIQGVTLVIAVIVVVVNLTVDILYTWLNPRIRLS